MAHDYGYGYGDCGAAWGNAQAPRSGSPYPEWRVPRGETPSTTLGVEGILAEHLSPIEGGIADVRNAMLAVANVISTWAKDTSNAAGMWGKHMDEQYERYAAYNDRWDAMQLQVSEVQAQLQRMDGALQLRAEAAEASAEASKQRAAQLEASLQAVAAAVDEVGRRSEAQAQAVSGTVAEHVDKVLSRVTELIYGEEHTSGCLAVVPQIQATQKGLQEVLTLTHEDVTKWQEMATNFQAAQKVAIGEVDLARGKAAEAEAALEGLRQEVTSLSEQLERSRSELQESKHAPVGAAFETVRGVEQRGRVRLNRQIGRIDVAQALEFAAPKVGTVSAEWKDPNAAEEALQDILELQRLFDGPMHADVRLRAGKGGKPDFWDKLAQAQAQFLKDELRRVGVPDLMLIAQGSQTSKNAEPGVSVTLKRDIFDAAAVAAALAAGGDALSGGKEKPGKK